MVWLSKSWATSSPIGPSTTSHIWRLKVNSTRGHRKAWPNRERDYMIALYKYIRRLIVSGGKELFNEKNMLTEEQMVMNYLFTNKFRLEIR